MRLACPELALWLDKGAVVVLPDAFLAEVAHQEFAQAKLRRGVETWERPVILTPEAWLVSRWQEQRYRSSDARTLLSRAQERALWHGVIEEEHPQLFDISATVRLAGAAAILLAEWEIPSEGALWNEHADAAQFQHWHRLLCRKCRENGWITRADLWRESGSFAETMTVFAGLDSPWPALRRIQNQMGALSLRLPFDDSPTPRTAAAKNFPDLAAELEFAARRLRYLFEEDTRRSLALLVPALAENHGAAERALHSVFFPSTAARASSDSALFRVANAGPLIDHPLVASALLLLNLALPRVDHADAGAILRCPFIAGAGAERSARALADLELRKRRELDVSFLDIQKASRACPALTPCWKRLGRLFEEAAPLRAFSDWSEFISALLTALGWPGETPLSDAEEEVMTEWQDRLSTLSALGLVAPPATLATALAHLRRLLTRPLTTGNFLSPIQVIDAADTRGLEFDFAIAVGVSEQTWPPPRLVSPLVPLRLQRDHGVPGSTARGAREERMRQTEALFRTAPQVVVTYQGRLASHAERFLSQDAGDLPLWEGGLADESFVLEPHEQISDGQAPPFVAQGELRGGTSVIKAQSLCPFKAFSEYRLNARSPEDASFGFDARERGGFVHKALENVWKELGSQARLKNMAGAELRELVKNAVADAVYTREEGPLHQLSVETERLRLEDLILEWLNLEHSRSEPFTVEIVEEEGRFEVPGLTLKLRVDRIDRLKNGSLVLIDYKSGKQTRPKLLGERPPEPQLLVYAAAAASPVEGIFFGQLKPRDVRAVGYSGSKQFSSNTAEVKTDWDNYIEASRQSVRKLAHEFVSGLAEVDPIKGACDYCGSKPFCRTNERGAAPEEEE